MKQSKTLYELLRNSTEQFPSRPAFEMLEGESVTYEEVNKRVKIVQELLLSAGLKPGDKVALLSSSMPNWGVCYLAVTSMSMVIVPILPDFTGEELDMILAHAEVKALLTSDKLFTKLSKATVEKMNIVIRTKSLKPLSQRVKEPGSMAEPKPEDLAAIIYTSGTTSTPKGVMLTHKAICTQIDIDYELFPVYEDDVFLSVLPLSHTYECSIGLLYAFACGSKIVYLDRPPTAAVLMPALKKVRPTLMMIVPLVIEKVYRSRVQSKFNSNALLRNLYKVGFIRRYLHRVAGKKVNQAFGGRIRFLGVGGAKLDRQTEQFLLEGKVNYAVGYGLTETAPLLAGAVPSKVRLGSTGPAAPQVELRIDNINPETGLGELVAKSPSVMLGYYKNPEATKEAFTEDGWFRTGDLAEFDQDGWVYIRGRLKNMIVGPSGENIYPEDIENVLNSHVFVADSVVTEKEGHLVALVHFNTDLLEAKWEEWKAEWDSKKGELKAEWDIKAKAFEEKKEELKKEILEYVNSKVNRFSRISEILEEKEDFIRTPTKKIRRFLYTQKPAKQNAQ